MPDYTEDQRKIRFQWLIAIFSVFLFMAKLLAWKITNSTLVFSDAMESIVNVVASFLGVYSLHLAMKPKDRDHPYGHGKVEFITAGVEGVLITIASLFIIAQGINGLITGTTPEKLDWGILIILATGVVNYLLGWLSYKKGKAGNSLVLMASGKHLQTDTYSTLGLTAGLILLYFTKLVWIDSLVAIGYALYIGFVGYKIIRKALGGIMDESDEELLTKIAAILEENRRIQWIDIHNMKIQQFGSHLHIDAHITLPWYYTLRDGHEEMTKAIVLLADKLDREVEFNFHMDDCKPTSCSICQILDCPVRDFPFKEKLTWTPDRLRQPQKHSL